MIWLETSPEATRLQVVFRSNQKKTNKQKNPRCKSQNNILGCNARPDLNMTSITLTWEHSRRRHRALEKNGTKIWFWPSQRTRKSFLWTKCFGVLIEVAICSPGYSQLPSLNAFFVSISKNPPLRCVYNHTACRYLS